MGEKEKIDQQRGPEHTPEAIDSSAAKENLERILEEAEKEKANGHGHDIEQLHTKTKERAFSSEETTIGEKESVAPQIGVQKELKSSAYKQTIKHVQTKLKGSDKVLSRVMHQPMIEKISNVGAKTIARPSGILGGGFITLIGSSLLLYFAKHYGFEYNYTVFFLLFIAGFVVGIVFEGLIRLVKRKRTTS